MKSKQYKHKDTKAQKYGVFMNSIFRVGICLLLVSWWFPFSAWAELPPLVARKKFFGNPVKDMPQISPGGKRLAYLAPSPAGVLNIWVKTIGSQDDRMITQDKTRGVFYFSWGYSDDHILFFQDKNGDENDHLKSVDLQNMGVRDLTPFPDVRAVNLLKDDQHPDEVLVGLNRRDPTLFDMYRVHLKTGKLSMEAQNPGDVIGWATDRNFQIRAHTAFRPKDLSTVIRVRDSIDRPWRDLLVTPFEKTPFLGQYNGGSLVVGFSNDGKHLYAVTCRDSDTTQLVKLDTASGKILGVLASHPKGDLYESEDKYEVLLDKKTGNVQVVWFEYTKPDINVVDPKVMQDIARLQKQESGIFQISSRDAADRLWVVKYLSNAKPEIYYLYDRVTGNLEQLMTPYPELINLQWAEQKEVLIPASDGMQLVGYLTLPPGIPAKNLPLVLNVHGGPWYRINWKFDKEVQWLANRGYAVLSPNFRGSAGLGVKYMNAGTGGWCVGKMQQDLTDSVKWAVDKGIADPKRIAISGGSYGGYATLCGITQTPDLYSCAVDLVGVSDVAFLLRSFPPYWNPVKKRWIRRIGYDVEKDEEANRKISPLYHVDKIKVPVLIGHGANDVRVKQEASDRIVKAMREKNLTVTYVVYTDEGHGLYREQNILDFSGRMEEFLGRCLRGRKEPYHPIPGSTAELR